jgi:tRNA nucleotidyltransferase (CCA-adding enzyme)
VSGDAVDLPAPEGLLELARLLEQRGHEAWAVGGAIRDELTGHHRADWDLATDARPRELRSLFRRTIPIGIEHGTVGVIARDGVMYEVTTFRRDVETDGRHAVIEFADSLEEDLARRDFTINALAWRPETGELRDPYGGRADLEEGVLRAVEDPALRFAEDYLRVLRGLRFAGRFGLEVEPGTERALSAAVSGTSELSAERVREELLKVMTGPHPSAAIRLYGTYGILDIWYPELAAPAAADARWELQLAAVDHVSAARPLVRVARLLVSAGASEGERVESAGALLQRLKFSNADIERVTELVRRYEPLPAPTDSDAQVREWIADVGRGAVRDLLRMHIATARAGGASEAGRYLAFLWGRVHAQLLSHVPLTRAELAVDGHDLMSLGVEEGPGLGILLDELHASVLEDPALNEREALLDLAREYAEMGGLLPGDGSRWEDASPGHDPESEAPPAVEGEGEGRRGPPGASP